MNARAFVCTAIAATLGVGTAAQARDWNHDGRQGGHHAQPQAQQRHGGTYQGRTGYQNYQRSYVQPQYRQQYHAQRSYAPRYQAYNNYAPQYRTHSYAPQYRSYAYAPRYFAGGYAPTYYGARRYWVNDWRVRGYAPPPYGYQWVQTDSGDVLLMALATGLIASAILAQ